MKKYFLRGISALMMGMGIASCHHEVENVSQYGVDVVAEKKEQFDNAFKNAFGTIASGQTWGFARTASKSESAQDGYIETDDVLGNTIGSYDFSKIREDAPTYEYLNTIIDTDGKEKRYVARTVIQHKYMPRLDYVFEARDFVTDAGRVFCEDLSSNYNDSKEYFDYNDAVFDASIIERTYIRKTTASIWEATRTATDYYTEDVSKTRGSDEGGEEKFIEYGEWGDFRQVAEVAPYKTKQLNLRWDKNSPEGVTVEPHKYARVILQAAGGTKDTKVLGEEVHSAFGTSTSMMVNIIDKKSQKYKTYIILDAVDLNNNHNGYDPDDEFDKTRKAIDDFAKGDDTLYPDITPSKYLFGGYEKVIDIPVQVRFDNKHVISLQAEIGEAPHKIAMQPERLSADKVYAAPWPDENCSIDQAYSDFNKTGSNQTVATWTNPNREYTYNEAEDITVDAKGTSTSFQAISPVSSMIIATLYDNSKDGDKANEGGYDISKGMTIGNIDGIVGMLKEGDIITVTGTIINADKSIAADATKNWMVSLSDGKSNLLDEVNGHNSDKVTATFTITKDIQTKLVYRASDQSAIILNGENIKVSTVFVIRTILE